MKTKGYKTKYQAVLLVAICSILGNIIMTISHQMDRAAQKERCLQEVKTVIESSMDHTEARR